VRSGSAFRASRAAASASAGRSASTRTPAALAPRRTEGLSIRASRPASARS
jgi:hypothetical protein